MNNIKKQLSKCAVVYYVTGSLYVLLELTFRNKSHISMFLLAGLVCTIISLWNDSLSWKFPLFWQSIIAGAFITLCEGICGQIVNVWLKLDVWDYGNLPFSFWNNQINLFFGMLWCVLGLVCILLSDWLLYWLDKWNELRPHYVWFHR